MEGKAACLFLADVKKDVFVPAAQKGLSENYLHASPRRAKQVVSDILKGGYFSVYDATTDPRLENHELKKAEGIASILDVPVMVKDNAVGVLALYTSSHRHFSEDEVNFLTALAEQGGIAIEQERLFDRIRKNSMLLHDLASSINSSLDIKKILHILTANIADALGMKGVVIRLLNKDTNTLDLVASYGVSEEFLGKGAVSAEKSVSEALKGATVVIKDAATDKRVQYREAHRKEGIVSILNVPLKSKDEVIGVMRLFSGVKREFPEDVVVLVEAIAHQGGLAIENASLYLALQDDKKSLEEDSLSFRSWF
jgi:GAF domain-containing protein